MATRSWIEVDTLWQSIWTMERLTVQLFNQPFQRLIFITDQLYEIEVVKLETEHQEPIIVGFFNC